MKNLNNNDRNPALDFRSVNIVRHDTRAIRIPVEMVENIKIPWKGRKVLRITMNRGVFYAWR